MKSLGSSFTVNGIEVDKVVSRKVALTIPNTGWVANTGDYVYKLNITISGVLATDEVNVNILPDDLDVAQAAQLAPYVEEYAGGITLYCKVVPTATMSAKYTIWR